jgi:hypothetical protein
MLTLGSCSAPQNTSTQVQPVSGGQITPLLESTLSTPRWFTGTDGQAHLVYELMLTNVLTGIQDEHDGGVDGEDVCA